MLVALVVVLGLALAGAVPAAAESGTQRTTGSPAARNGRVPGLPPDFTLTPGTTTDRLLWRPPQGGPGDARVQFFAGDRLLGTPRPTAGGEYRLDVPSGSVAGAAELQVRAGDRRLDAAGVAARNRRRAGPETPPGGRPPVLPAAGVDPGRPGPFATVTGEYSLPAVKLPDYPVPVEMQAVVVAPRAASGRRPIALFVHGQHSICYGGDPDGSEEPWPCPGGSRPVPSYRGYLVAQRLLASQGYVTVSISANGVNAQDWRSDDGNDDLGAQARSSLIRLHLAHWADWSGAGRAGAPAVVRSVARADLAQVLLIGHSRGGDGVNRAAIDSLNPPPSALDGYHGPVRWTIRGTLQVAPTLFGKNPAADVPSVVLLPGCDGDVYDLHGQATVDGTRTVSTGTALHSAVFVVGANHNYFNAEWTPGSAAAPAWDDWSDDTDPVCGAASATSVRLSPDQQQTVGATYAAAAARLFVQGDDRVRPLLDGSGVRAPSADPARVLSHAVGAARDPFVLPAADLSVDGPARLCRQVTRDDTACVASGSALVVPSFVPFFPLPEDPDRYAVDLTWTSAGGAGARLTPRRPVSLAADRSVAVRLIVPVNTPATGFDVAVTDASGRSARLGRVSLSGLPGTDRTVGAWAQEVRVPLAAARRAGLNLHRISALRVVPQSRHGQAYLLDAWGWRPGTPAVRVAARTRIDLGSHAPVDETDGVVTYRLPVSFTGSGTGVIRLTPFEYNSRRVGRSRLVTVRPGMHRIDVPVQVTGDTFFTFGGRSVLLAEAVSGSVVAGTYQGSIDVIDDDPAPTLTVTPIADRVTEGTALRWRVTLSAPALTPLYIVMSVQPPASGTELSTTDVPAEWVQNVLFADPLPERPLSAAQGYLFVEVPAGETGFEVTVPTVVDDLAESAEQIRLTVEPFTVDPLPEPVELTGSVLG